MLGGKVDDVEGSALSPTTKHKTYTIQGPIAATDGKQVSTTEKSKIKAQGMRVPRRP